MNENMHISLPGIAYLKGMEEPGGRCRLKAYNDGGNTPTIAWGCTHGVHYGMVITEDQGVSMFNVEIAEIEDGMRKWLKREVDQDTWDVCVFFGYNCGWGKCQSFKDAVNSGSDAKLRAAEMLFTHGYSQAAGRVVEWPGLVSRRKQEIAYFDTHHSLSGDRLPVPQHVGEEAPKVNATTPPKPHIVVAAGSSPTVHAHVMGIGALVGVVQGWWNGLMPHFAIPAADGDGLSVQGLIDQGQQAVDQTRQVAGWFNADVEHMVIWIVIAVLGYSLIQHVIKERGQHI